MKKERVMAASKRPKKKVAPRKRESSVPDTPTLIREHGVWVLYTGEPLPACADTLPAQIQKQREKTNF
jgi:hypothetical protein